MTELTALVLNCTLKPAPTASSSEVLGTEVLEALSAHGVTGDMVRVTDHQVKFGVNVDEGDGDGWPDIRRRMLDADILVIATPIWLGQPSSVGARVAVQIRHRAAPAAAEIIRVTADEIELALDEPVSAITPGQSVGIYDGDRMLGGGVIESARGQKSELPVLAA